MALVHNERPKVTRERVERRAIATMAAGFIAPIVAVSYGISSAPAARISLAIGAIWFFTAIGIHIVARIILGGLQGMTFLASLRRCLAYR